MSLKGCTAESLLAVPNYADDLREIPYPIPVTPMFGSAPQFDTSAPHFIYDL